MLILIVQENRNPDASIRELLDTNHRIMVCRDPAQALRELQATVGRADAIPPTLRVVSRPESVMPAGGERGAEGGASTQQPEAPHRGLNEIIEEIEGVLVHEAMEETGRNQVQAAKILRITRGALQYKLKKYFKPSSLKAA